ncbi:MAG: sigma-70 family RNA polymerase sigma factor [Actinomycetota bacterium]|nr:sigma-70 family RNA polymerase sigma factor [Actinomycetota bacterium]
MSPEAKRDFEAEWPVLSRRLRSMLARKRVPACQVDDVIQETALRLLKMWESVDRRRALWPLVATIALNLLRDRSRIGQRHDLVAELPEVQGIHDVEIVSIARLELRRVHDCMDKLSSGQRSALMKEIGAHSGAAAPDAVGDKMLRMRARRKLRSMMERVSGLVAVRLRHAIQLTEGAVVLQDGGLKAASCAICFALGIGGTVLAGPLAPAASAAAAPVTVQRLLLPAPRGLRAAAYERPDVAAAEARAVGAAAREAAARSSTRKKAQRESARSQEGLIQSIPTDANGQVAVSDGAVEAPEAGGPPPLPGDDGDGSTITPPPTTPPPTPEPPTDNRELVPAEVQEVADTLL